MPPPCSDQECCRISRRFGGTNRSKAWQPPINCAAQNEFCCTTQVSQTFIHNIYRNKLGKWATVTRTVGNVVQVQGEVSNSNATSGGRRSSYLHPAKRVLCLSLWICNHPLKVVVVGALRLSILHEVPYRLLMHPQLTTIVTTGQPVLRVS